MTSKAILKASDDLLQRLKMRAAAALEAALHDIVYERKRFWVQGSPERAMALADIAHLVRFEQGDAERLAFTDGQFDAVICECAFCTFPDKSAAANGR